MKTKSIADLYMEFKQSKDVSNFIHRCIEDDYNDQLRSNDLEKIAQEKTCRMVLNHLLKTNYPDMNRAVVSRWVSEFDLLTISDLNIAWNRFQEFYQKDKTLACILTDIKYKYYKEPRNGYKYEIKITIKADYRRDQKRLEQALIKFLNEDGIFVDGIICTVVE